MTILSILQHPDPRLHNKAYPVKSVHSLALQKIIADVLETPRNTKKCVACLDHKVNPVKIKTDVFFDRYLQHEIAHLNGFLLIDHVPRLKRCRVGKDIEKKLGIKILRG